MLSVNIGKDLEWIFKRKMFLSNAQVNFRIFYAQTLKPEMSTNQFFLNESLKEKNIRFSISKFKGKHECLMAICESVPQRLRTTSNIYH